MKRHRPAERAASSTPRAASTRPARVIVERRQDRRRRQDALNQGAPEGADSHRLRAARRSLPGLVDARVFIGEPGAEHRETIASASHAAAAGGVTSIIMMPDTDPVIDDVALVEFVLRTARDTAWSMSIRQPRSPRACRRRK